MSNRSARVPATSGRRAIGPGMTTKATITGSQAHGCSLHGMAISGRPHTGDGMVWRSSFTKGTGDRGSVSMVALITATVIPDTDITAGAGRATASITTVP